MSFNKNDFLKKLENSITKYRDDLASINVRISTNILNPVRVDVYGEMKPINQVANVSVAGASVLNVQSWDKALTTAVVKAIQSSGLGLNPVVDGANIKVPIPPITEQRRKELSVLVKGYLENAKISMRNIRNHERDRLKVQEKAKEISEDDFKRAEKELQKVFDSEIEKAEKLCEDKTKEILA